MEYLEDLARWNSGFAEEAWFGVEMLAAAQLMGRSEDAQQFRRNWRSIMPLKDALQHTCRAEWLLWRSKAVGEDYA